MTTKDFQTKRPLAIFLSYFRPHRRLFALDIICAFMISLVDLAFPLISRTAMYQWLPQQQYRTFFIVMGIVVLAFVLRSFLCFVVGYWGHTFGIRVEADIRRDLFRHMQELGFDFYDRNRTGQLDQPPDLRPVRGDGTGPPRPGGSVHLRSDHRGRPDRHVLHPVASGAGGESHHPHFHGGGHVPPPPG